MFLLYFILFYLTDIILNYNRVVGPKKESADAALALLKDKQTELITAQVKLEELQNILMKLKINFDKKMEEKEQLIKKVKNT